ncbi:MAG: S8 family serine peptidase [Fibrobacter sp.]|nr:S8 family serine peptidase [Fibrobacter sp.]
MKNKVPLFLLVAVSVAQSLTLVGKCKEGVVLSSSMYDMYCCQRIEKLYKNSNGSMAAGKKGIDRVYIMEFTCNVDDTARVLRECMSSGLYEYVEVNNYLTSIAQEPFYPNDMAFYNNMQWGLHNKGGIAWDGSPKKEDVDIDMPEAWSIEKGDSNVIIAILDSGIKGDFEDFDGRVWINRNDPFDLIDNDSNGYADDFRGYNFTSVGNGGTIDDVNGHGTAVASIIGANLHNREEMAGINGYSKLMILKVTEPDGRSLVSDIAEAIYYAADNGARVINLSHANPMGVTTVEEAIEYAHSKKVVVCAGAGNDNVNQIYYPARFKNVIAVGGTTQHDKRCLAWMGHSESGGSNFGDSLDVVAPGEFIYTITLEDGAVPFKSGTSMATAFVSGLASLLVSQNPDLTSDMVTEIICSTAEDQVGDPSEDTKGYDKYYGHGRINAFNALLKGEELKTGRKSKALVNREISRWISWSRPNRQLSINVEGAKTSGSGIVVRIFNASGRVLKVVSLPDFTGSHTVSLPSLSSGVHLYSIQCDNGTWSGKILD